MIKSAAYWCVLCSVGIMHKPKDHTCIQVRSTCYSVAGDIHTILNSSSGARSITSDM